MNTQKWMIAIGLAYCACLSCKFAPRADQGLAVFIEHGSTASPKQIVKIDLLKSGIYKNEIWKSQDGASCSLTPYGGSMPNSASFDCWTKDGYRNQLSIDCKKIKGKEHSLTYFIGGVDKYNRNFEIWCE